MNDYMNPALLVANSISDLNSNKLTMYPKPGLDKDERAIVEDEANALFEKIREGNLDFITDALTAHVIILNNIASVCHKKAKGGDYFREFTELSIKASEQLRKSGLALAQIKNVILNIENLTIQQQNNLLQLNQAGQELCNCHPIPEVADVKKVL